MKPIAITGISVHRVEKAYDGTLWNPAFRWFRRTAVLVRVHTAAGVSGIGECWTFDTDIAALVAFLRTEIAPRIVGMDARLIEAVAAASLRGMALRARQGIAASAHSGIDIALWDIAGKLAGRPVWKLLGGCRERELTRIRTKVGMVFQQFNLFPHKTALENVMEGLLIVRRLPRAEAEERARANLKKVGLIDKAGQYPSRLSGGQQQRVAIARALAMEPAIMLYDEVTSSLDPELVGEVLRAMRDLAHEGMTMLVVTHELGFAYHVAKKVLFLHEGVIHEQGTPDEVLKNPRQERTKAFLTGFTDFYF